MQEENTADDRCYCEEVSMTPLQLDQLMSIYVSPQGPNLSTETHIDQFNILIEEDLVCCPNETWSVTAKGEAMVKHILATPFPDVEYVINR